MDNYFLIKNELVYLAILWFLVMHGRSLIAGAKFILVMGHEHCGAVKAAIDYVKLGNITNIAFKDPACSKFGGICW